MFVINNNYEKSFREWFDNKYKNGDSYDDEILLEIHNMNDIYSIQYYVLMCQKYGMNNITLRIKCPENEQYRVAPYALFLRENYKIFINDKVFLPQGEIESFLKQNKNDKNLIFLIKENSKFRRIFPLIQIDYEYYSFFSKTVSEIIVFKQIKKEFGINQNIKKLEFKKLANLCIKYLLKEIDNCQSLSDKRKEYFCNNKFYERVSKMPFMAFMVFCYYNSEKTEDLVEEKKTKIKSENTGKRVQLNKDNAAEVFPNDEKINEDIFNALDISDGLLQLVENVVQYAPPVVADTSLPIEKRGKGIISLRVLRNKEDKEIGLLTREYNSYFNGNENVYKSEYEKDDQLLTELEYCKELSDSEDPEDIKKVLKIKNDISERGKRRKKETYYLNIQIADASGECMTDVFLRNLQKRNYKDSKDFENISVRSLFDPNKNEKEKFDNYYKNENLIYHYGLQIFSSVVLNNDGYFKVISTSGKNSSGYCTSNEDKIIFEDTIPGTRYDILIPVIAPQRQYNTMVNSDIQYVVDNKGLYKVRDKKDNTIKEITNILAKYEIEQEDNKSIIVEEIANKFNDKNNEIMLFDIDYINYSSLEIFCKAMILHIIKNDGRHNYAIINCEDNHFINIIRMFGVCYDKNGNGEWMKDTQVYLCGKECTQEFLISGASIGELLQRVEKLAFSRKIHPNCVSLLRKMLEKRGNNRNDRKNEASNFEYTPFDLSIYKNGLTIFENNVKYILERNIQGLESGCLNAPIHTRLGSKIHIDGFYEADLLFYNNYYTNRFAYLMTNRILSSEEYKKALGEKVCFLGYESYSEMLLWEMKQMFNAQMAKEGTNKQANYAIYENQKEGVSVRYIERLIDVDSIVVVVPISTTLTTFNKIKSYVESDNRIKQKYIVIFLGVIQVRDKDNDKKLEKEYWEDFDEENRTIKSYLLGYKDGDFTRAKSAWYQVCVASKWHDPLKCKMCFPEEVLDEKPLIETDKTSVVPMQLIGLHSNKLNNQIIMNDYRQYSRESNIGSLRDYIFYGHITRDNNHFKYYIQTANYIQNEQSNIEKWLSKVNGEIENRKTDNIVYYDIIISPMHFSSTCFVELVNEFVFKGASYVIRIDAGKEYRDNVQTKYSDLIILVDNLIKSEIKACVNFHYVDDNIISGTNYNRVKHLINSLFVGIKEKKNITINVFESVIVLLNRLSNSSINSYIDNERYFSYVNLNIPSLRNHKDACYICRYYDNACDMISRTSQNSIVSSWEGEKKINEPQSLEEAEKNNDSLEHETKEKLFVQLLFTHKINSVLDEISFEKNNTYIAFEKILTIFNDVSTTVDYVKYLPEFIKVISTPYISERKSIRECSLFIIIFLLEIVIKNRSIEDICKSSSNSSGYTKIDDLNNLINEYKTKKYPKRELVKELIIASVNLKSNYIIRLEKENLKNIIEFYTNEESKIAIGDRQRYQEEIVVFLTTQVKKLVSLSTDEAKSVYLEQNLVYELINDTKTTPNDLYSKTLCSIYLENTRTIWDARIDISNKIKPYLRDNKDDKAKKELKKILIEYYLKNYVNILKINDYKETEEYLDISYNIAKMYELLMNKGDVNPRGGEQLEFYNELCGTLKDLTTAEKVYFVIENNKVGLELNGETGDVRLRRIKEKKYEIFASTERKEENYKEEIYQKIIDCSRNYINDTYVMSEDLCIINLFYNTSMPYQYNFLEERNGKNIEEENNHNKIDKTNDAVSNPILLVIRYKKSEEGKNAYFTKMRGLRWIIMFRKSLSETIKKDIDNNVFQNWLKSLEALNQLKKARAGFHSNASDAYADNDWNKCVDLIFNNCEKEKEIDKLQGLIFDLMTDIRIGRINSALLAQQPFKEMSNNPIIHETDVIKDDIEQIKKARYRNEFVVYDENFINPRNNIFDDEITNSKLERNKDGFNNLFNYYLIYIIFETIHSAVKYGVREIHDSNKEHVKVSIYKKGIYLCICNKVKEDFDIKKITDGIERKGEGISLATIGEYFLREYKDRCLNITLENETLIVKLPIFCHDKESEEMH